MNLPKVPYPQPRLKKRITHERANFKAAFSHNGLVHKVTKRNQESQLLREGYRRQIKGESSIIIYQWKTNMVL
jgi:hypothetical protein